MVGGPFGPNDDDDGLGFSIITRENQHNENRRYR